jgi:GT2 family glycosyltransferase
MSAPNAALRKFESNSPDRYHGWKVLHVELSQIRSITLEPDYQGVYICFWHEYRPLGHRELLAQELPLSEVQLRNITVLAIAPAVHSYLRTTDASDRCEANTDRPGMDARASGLLSSLTAAWRREQASFVARDASLIICTRDRPEQLRRCLQSTAHLSFQPAEIIVVDNGSRREDTRSVAQDFPKVHYVVEPVTGLSRARNTGIRASTCPLVAFTDDDIILTRDWLFHLVHALHDPTVAAASGLVFPAEMRTEAQVLFEQGFGGFHQGYEPRTYGPEFIRSTGRKAAPVWSVCAGGNMIVRRETFDSLGLFDERLGAGAAGCSEDSEFWYRILANGGKCAYAPAAAVHHYHREDLESLRLQIFMYMRGHVAALLAQFARSRHWSNLHRVIVELPLYFATTWFRALVRGEQGNLILTESARGSAAGIWYWIQHARKRANS